jgi:hypothetical protein
VAPTLGMFFEVVLENLVLPSSVKECNYGLRAAKNNSCLNKFLVNGIHIYDSKLIYYENTFHN